MSEQASFWDDPDVKVSSSFAKFETVGDTVAGTIARLGKHVWTDGSVGVEILFTEDDVPTLTASQTLLKQALFNLRPAVKDHLSITLAGIERLAGGKTLKRFRIELIRANGEVEKIDQTADTPPPF